MKYKKKINRQKYLMVLILAKETNICCIKQIIWQIRLFAWLWSVDTTIKQISIKKMVCFIKTMIQVPLFDSYGSSNLLVDTIKSVVALKILEL